MDDLSNGTRVLMIRHIEYIFVKWIMSVWHRVPLIEIRSATRLLYVCARVESLQRGGRFVVC